MSRMIAYGALSAASLTSASVGGYYLFNSRGHGEDAEPTSIAPTPLSFESLSAFKESAKSNAVGIGEYFPELDISRDGESVADDLTNAGTFFDGLKANELGAKSYLRIEHKTKDTRAGWDWAGKFTWLWVFAAQDRGMITFGDVETIDRTKFTAQAVLYLVQKEGDDWKIKYKKDSGNKEIVQHEFDNQFPRPSGSFSDKSMADEDWGFVNKNDKSVLLSSMCAWESCSTPLTKKDETLKVLRWRPDEGSSSKTSPGSLFSNSGWCKHFFGAAGEKLMKLEIPKGIWTLDTEASSIKRSQQSS